MINVPQSVALLVVFKAFLSSDHTTEATGKTIAITISKNGGAFGNPNAGALNATEISSGWYKASLDTTDIGTLGPLAVRGAVATIDDVSVMFQVVVAGLTAAAVNAEVVDALATDTYAEPGQGAPAATTSLSAKINYLYKWARNKLANDGTTLKMYADDASTVDQKATVADDGTTFTRGEIASGP